MSTITDPRMVRKSKTTAQKARAQMKKIRDCAAPHIAIIVAEAKRISCKAAVHIPENAKRGFRDGRQAGNDLVRKTPDVVGASAGLVFGVGEAVVGAMAAPFAYLFGLGKCAVRANRD